MALETNWSQINLYLPVNTVEEIEAASAMIVLVRNNYEGATHSVVRPHVFEGYCWDDDEAKWERDEICWLKVDINYPLASTELDTHLAIIQMLVDELYKDAEHKQRDIWLTTHPIANFRSVEEET